MDNSTTPQDDAAMSPASAGSVAGEPAAWAVKDSRGMVCVAYICREAAEAYCEGTFNRLAPLYSHLQPTLTAAEREAVDRAAHAAAQLYVGPEGVGLAATLRGLLARLGG